MALTMEFIQQKSLTFWDLMIQILFYEDTTP